jgi:hypothetical protein
MWIRVLSLASVLALVDCSSQADPSYPGQLLATLQGEAIAVDPQPLPPLQVGLEWFVSVIHGADGGVTLLNSGGHTMTSVSGDFPSSFTLQLFQPPPEDEMIPCLADDPSHPAAGRYAMGVIAAFGAAPEGLFESDSGLVPYGWAAEFALVYANSNLSVCKGDVNKYVDPARLSKGYHLYRQVVGPCTPTGSGGCSSFTEVPMTTTINLPIWGPYTPQHSHIWNIAGGSQSCLGEGRILPIDGAGDLACRLVFTRYSSNGMPDWGPCDGPGEMPVDDETVAELTFMSLMQPTTFCELVQIPGTAWVNGSCAQSTQSGWCFPPSTATCTSPVQLSDATPSLNPASATNFEAKLVCP